MNITFLIGNGFDIGLGAPTRYTDFYQWLLNTARGKPLLEKKNEKEVESPLKKVMDSIESNYELWADLEVARGKYPQYLLNQQRVLQKDLEYPLYVKEKLIEKKLIEQLNKSFDALDNALGEYLALVEKDYQLSYASDKENELFYETDKENEFHRALLNFFADLPIPCFPANIIL